MQMPKPNWLSKQTVGAIDIMSVVIQVVLVVALIPVIKTFVAGAQNLSATETTMLGLVTLFIVIALVFSVVKGSGLTKKN